MIAEPRLLRRDLIIVAALVAACLPVPFMTTSAGREVAIRIAMFAAMGIAWNIMAGYGGMFSFGHAAFFGIGAYTSGYLLVNHTVSPWIGMVAGAGLAALFGALTAFLSLRYRLKGAYFVLTTFAFAEMLRLIALNLDLINAAVGLRVPLLQESSLWFIQFPPGSPAYFFVILGIVAVTQAVVLVVLRSKYGFYLIAIRDNEESADAIGLDPMRFKIGAVAMSAASTAVVGAFYFQFIFFIDPHLAFGPQVSVQILLPAIIGGMGTLWGPIVGAGLLGALSEVTTGVVRSPPALLGFLGGRSGLDLAIFGALLIVIIIFLPKGVYGTIEHRLRMRRDRQKTDEVTARGE